MKASKAQLAALRRFEKENTVRVGLVLNRNTDADIIAWLETKESKMGAIKAAIREEMKRGG